MGHSVSHLTSHLLILFFIYMRHMHFKQPEGTADKFDVRPEGKPVLASTFLLWT